MRFKKSFIIPLVTLAMTGCGSMPSTPELLVQNAKGGKIYSDKDVFEVKKPASQVASILKSKSSECLKKTVTSGYWQNGTYHSQIIVLTPKFKRTKNYSQLTLQSKHTEAGNVNVGPIPADGWYMMVVNVYPVDKHTSRVEEYYQDSSFKGAFTAVKLWATGKNMGCPDLTS